MEYSINLKNKNCEDCGNEILATEKQKLCDGCRSKRRRDSYKPIERNVLCHGCHQILYQEICKGKKTKNEIFSSHLCNDCKTKLNHSKLINRKIVCRKCGSLLYEELIRNGPNIIFEKKGKLCKWCKEKSLMEHKKRSAQIWKDYNKFIREHPENKPIWSEETRKRVSTSMKKNNPMKDPTTVEKMKSTIKKRILTGGLVYKRGKDHWLFKGNRAFNASCRKDLYKTWILPIMMRDNFHCTKCHSSTNLQVHHIRPLRDIVDMILAKNNIKNPNALLKTDYDLFIDLVNQVIFEHKLSDGITVCKDCHIDIDSRYRVKKA